jgi:hypothetical protein
MKRILAPACPLTFGFLITYVCSVGVQGATTVIDLSVNSISQPFTNTTEVITNGSQYAFRIFDIGQSGASQSSQNAGNGASVGGISGVTNQANMVLNSFGPGQAQGVFYQSRGGDGGNYTSENDNNNAGSGGNGGNVSGSNAGDIRASGNFDTGVAIFRGESYGGQGGSAANNEGRGGNGGNGGEVNLANTGFLSISEGSVNGGTQYRGILGFSRGGAAGSGSSGASGGSSGNVSVESDGRVKLTIDAGDPSQATSLYGILAQSSGGDGADSLKQNQNGGNGGNSGTVSVRSDLIDLDARGQTLAADSAGIGTFTFGGNGGKAANGDSNNISLAGRGGNAGAITVDVPDSINVKGDGLLGVNARALGGQGGGGTNNEKSFSNDGGNAGDVRVTLSGIESEIRTAGIGATGIRALTISGDGGNTPLSDQLQGGTAGDGGDGGQAGLVGVTLTGKNHDVRTSGASSVGILAGSEGGDGGDGGQLSTIFDATGGGPGDGGAGAAGGNISIELIDSSAVFTAGDDSTGISAVSSGGNGGAGGEIFDDSTGDGGTGGNGGNGGIVSVDIEPDAVIMTGGARSSAILASSLSGKGGTGGTANATISGSSGAGGFGGNTGLVVVLNSGTLSTSGIDSYGIVAQGFSGGGGGSGNGLSVFNTDIDQAGTSGSVGLVQVFNFGSISTLGDNSYGVLAQSVSGSGGVGGSSQSFVVPSLGGDGAFATNGGDVEFDHNGTITTAGQGSHGAVIQTIGGGGGDGGSATGIVSIGGSGTGGGAGGSITSELFQSNITTTGTQAIGYLGQSIGGGGGNGGDAVAVSPGFAVSLGGTAGAGGNGGNIDLLSSGNISTGGGVVVVPDQDNPGETLTLASGSRSSGIVLQSVGGGGGNGGSAYSLSVGAGLSVAAALGGSGGNGGHGGDVTLTTEGGSIRTGQYDLSKLTTANTLPTDAIGILAQSIGGGGGNGGGSFAEALAIAIPIPGTDVSVGAAGTFSAGGKGGGGGDGGGSVSGNGVLLNLTKGTSIMTEGQGSHGVLAQGIGGGGGNGGDSSAFSATLGYGFSPNSTPTVSLNVDVTLGGTGGSGGKGGKVFVNVGDEAGANTSILTLGDFSNGVTAQSIGGGGGNAGIGSGTTENYGASISASASIALGSSGGGGGTGGSAAIDLKSGSVVTTYGDGSNGLLVQSIGGGGGTSQGGTLSLGVAFPVEGEFLEGTPISKGAVQGSLDVTLGATGGSGGDGGNALGTVGGNVFTFGNDSTGVLIQSIGGGGGVAGAAGAFASPDVPWIPDGSIFERVKKLSSGDFRVPVETDFSANISIGSLIPGASGRGGLATFDDIGGSTVQTSGDWSHGVVVQSIGGGGGKAGSAVATGLGAENRIDLTLGANNQGSNPGSGSNGSTATATLNNTTIRTGFVTEQSGANTGFSALGLVLQSIGGGGGIVADNSDSAFGNISVGQASSNAKPIGNSGEVSLAGSATISTSGLGGHAVLMQSIGGGGGIGGAGTSSVNAFGSTIALTVGGGNGSVGFGSDVRLAEGSVLDLKTSGDHSYGLLAQSIGGGGGLGAILDPESVSFVTTQSGDGSTNRGGTIDLNLGSSKISTIGIASHGVVAQGIGGGGGIAGYESEAPLRISNPTSGFGVGNGGRVFIKLGQQGTIATSGDGAHGILAQSIGGGGGILRGFAGRANRDGSAVAGDVSVEVDGSISVTGAGSYGIFAQQDAPNAPGPTAPSQAFVRVGGSVVSQDVGVVIDSENGLIQIDSGGTIEGQTAAIQRLGPSATTLSIVNNGTLNGSILANSFSRAGSGVLNANTSEFVAVPSSGAAGASLINTGEFIAGPLVQADVTNHGILRVRGLTRLEGTLVQTSSGTILAETDFASDDRGRLLVDGDADLDGKIQIAGTNVNGNREVEVLRVENGDFTNSLEVDGDSSKLFRYTLRRNGDRLLVRAAADFSRTDLSLSRNAVSAGNYLERAFQARGNEGLVDLFAVLEELAAEDQSYTDAIEQLTAGTTLAFASREVWAQQALAEDALGEKNLSANSARPVEVQSMWAKTSGGTYDGDTYDVDSYSSMIGGQWEYSPNFFIGGALGYRSDRLDSNDGTISGDGDAALGALTLKYEPGDWSFAAALTGSLSSNDTTRRITIPGYAAELDGSPDVSSFGLFGQVGYTFHNQRSYVRPMLTSGLVHVRADGYSERGPSNLRLQIDGEGQTALIVTPGVEAGFRTDLSNGMTLRTYASGGLSLSTADEFEQRSSFAEGPSGIGNFNNALPQDDVVVRIATGFQIQFTESWSGYLQYQGEFADSATSNGAGLGLRAEF